MTPGIWQILIVLIYLAVVVYPIWRIVSRAGFSGAWSLLALIPLINLIMLWVFALSRWPAETNDVEPS